MKHDSPTPSRRDALKKLVGLPLLGGAGSVSVLHSFEETCLAEEIQQEDEEKTDGTTGATRRSFTPPKRPKLKEKVPMSQIGNVPVSRMFLGGNLIGGWAHARDLIYVSDLVKAYHTEEKVYETFYLAEQCGINLFLGHYSLFKMVSGYWKWTPGKMQFFADCSTTDTDTIKKIVDDGAVGIYMQGEVTDRLVREGNFSLIEQTLETMRKTGVPTGAGAHRVETVRALVEHDLVPDFWMKTYHNHNYWSAHNKDRGEHDNIFCRRPEETKDFMAERKEPWIAFKVLAAGALRPQAAFRHAFEGGADFICVGMYDFQVVQNVNTCVEVLLHSELNRSRPWMTPTLDRKELLKQQREETRKTLQES